MPEKSDKSIKKEGKNGKNGKVKPPKQKDGQKPGKRSKDSGGKSRDTKLTYSEPKIPDQNQYDCPHGMPICNSEFVMSYSPYQVTSDVPCQSAWSFGQPINSNWGYASEAPEWEREKLPIGSHCCFCPNNSMVQCIPKENVNVQTHKNKGKHKRRREDCASQQIRDMGTQPTEEQKDDLWNLQFERWWGWQWQRQKDDERKKCHCSRRHHHRQHRRPPQISQNASCIKIKPNVSPKVKRQSCQRLPIPSPPIDLPCMRQNITRINTRMNPIARTTRKKIQQYFNTPCSSVVYGDCLCRSTSVNVPLELQTQTFITPDEMRPRRELRRKMQIPAESWIRCTSASMEETINNCVSGTSFQEPLKDHMNTIETKIRHLKRLNNCTSDSSMPTTPDCANIGACCNCFSSEDFVCCDCRRACCPKLKNRRTQAEKEYKSVQVNTSSYKVKKEVRCKVCKRLKEQCCPCRRPRSRCCPCTDKNMKTQSTATDGNKDNSTGRLMSALMECMEKVMKNNDSKPDSKPPTPKSKQVFIGMSQDNYYPCANNMNVMNFLGPKTFETPLHKHVLNLEPHLVNVPPTPRVESKNFIDAANNIEFYEKLNNESKDRTQKSAYLLSVCDAILSKAKEQTDKIKPLSEVELPSFCSRIGSPSPRNNADGDSLVEPDSEERSRSRMLYTQQIYKILQNGSTNTIESEKTFQEEEFNRYFEEIQYNGNFEETQTDSMAQIPILSPKNGKHIRKPLITRTGLFSAEYHSNANGMRPRKIIVRNTKKSLSSLKRMREKYHCPKPKRKQSINSCLDRTLFSMTGNVRTQLIEDVRQNSRFQLNSINNNVSRMQEVVKKYQPLIKNELGTNEFKTVRNLKKADRETYIEPSFNRRGPKLLSDKCEFTDPNIVRNHHAQLTEREIQCDESNDIEKFQNNELGTPPNNIPDFKRISISRIPILIKTKRRIKTLPPLSPTTKTVTNFLANKFAMSDKNRPSSRGSTPTDHICYDPKNCKVSTLQEDWWTDLNLDEYQNYLDQTVNPHLVEELSEDAARSGAASVKSKVSKEGKKGRVRTPVNTSARSQK